MQKFLLKFSLPKDLSDLFLGENCLTKTQVLTLLSRNLYGRYPKDSKYKDSEYEVHQVGLKDSGIQHFRILAFKGEAVGVTQIYPTTAATATTVRDRRKTNTSRIFHMWQVQTWFCPS
jgi:hypothetical protein